MENCGRWYSSLSVIQSMWGGGWSGLRATDEKLGGVGSKENISTQY